MMSRDVLQTIKDAALANKITRSESTFFCDNTRIEAFCGDEIRNQFRASSKHNPNSARHITRLTPNKIIPTKMRPFSGIVHYTRNDDMRPEALQTTLSSIFNKLSELSDKSAIKQALVLAESNHQILNLPYESGIGHLLQSIDQLPEQTCPKKLIFLTETSQSMHQLKETFISTAPTLDTAATLTLLPPEKEIALEKQVSKLHSKSKKNGKKKTRIAHTKDTQKKENPADSLHHPEEAACSTSQPNHTTSSDRALVRFNYFSQKKPNKTIGFLTKENIHSDMGEPAHLSPFMVFIEKNPKITEHQLKLFIGKGLDINQSKDIVISGQKFNINPVMYIIYLYSKRQNNPRSTRLNADKES